VTRQSANCSPVVTVDPTLPRVARRVGRPRAGRARLGMTCAAFAVVLGAVRPALAVPVGLVGVGLAYGRSTAAIRLGLAGAALGVVWSLEPTPLAVALVLLTQSAVVALCLLGVARFGDGPGRRERQGA